MSRNFTSLVQLSLCSELDLNAYLILNKKPTRQEQKYKSLNKYINQHSSGWKKRLELANLLYETGKWSEAVLEFERVTVAQPRLIEPRLQLGKILQLINRKTEAIAVYQEALILSENLATQQHLVGLIESCKGNNNTQKAIAAFQSVTNLETRNLAHWLALGQLYIEAEHPTDALATFETILSLDPNNLMGLVYSHDLFLALGNFPEAEKLLSKALAVAPEDVQTLKRVITNRCRKRLVFGVEGKQTKKLIQTLIKQASSSAEAYNLLAHYYIFRGDRQKGIEISKQFAKEHDRNPHAWYYYSQSLLDISENEAAAEAILKAHQLFSGGVGDWRSYALDHRQVYRSLCEILPAAGRLDKTHAIIAEMLQYFPQSWSVWAIAGRVCVKYLQQSDIGCSYSLRGTTLQPQLADAWLCHGRVLSLADQHQQAISALTQGWQLISPKVENFKSVSAAVWLGESYQKLGNNHASQKWLQTAVQKAEKLIEFDPIKANYWQDRALAGSRRL